LNTRSQCNYVRTTPILTQAKLGKAFETMVAKQWLGMKVANLWAVGAAPNKVPVLYEKNRPALARHKFWHNFILSLSRELGKEKLLINEIKN
jgi:hypothetical protein